MRLAEFSGKSDRELPARKLGDKSPRGFEIALKKIDPDAGDGWVRVWPDPDTKLPLRVEIDYGERGTEVLDEFAWDLPTDGWFDTKPPAKYEDKTPNAPHPDEVTESIVTGLKTYAKYCGNKYPRADKVYGDVTSEEMFRAAGLTPPTVRAAPDDELRRPEYVECGNASRGFGWINHLQRHNAEAVYNGKTVGPDGKDKVLLRWKQDDGQYRVIFGDLRHETVDAERLKKLEGR
jgi:hypothetical protein